MTQNKTTPILSRVPTDVKDMVVNFAKTERRSVSSMAALLLEEAVANREEQKKAG